MTYKILLIRRLQDDLDWENDAFNIAKEVIKELNYDFPYPEYYEICAGYLAKYICEDLQNERIHNLNDLFYQIFREGFDRSLQYESSPEYYEFKLTDQDQLHIENLISKHTKIYYNTYKTNLTKYLNSIPKETILIYPAKFYLKLLKSFYSPKNQIFESSYNNDKECITQFCKLYHTKDYEIISIKKNV